MLTGGPARLICHEYGDAALLVDVEADDYAARWTSAQSLGEALRDTPPPGLVDVVASYQHVFVAFDPLVTDHDTVRRAVRSLAAVSVPQRSPQHFVIPAIYGGDFGPDLERVAAALSMSPDDVVTLHVSGLWTVRFVGSPVGAPMMDGPELPAPVPRLSQPRARVEPGSIALSGVQSLVYNAPSPGGWQVIGRTPARLFDLNRSPHVPYRAGDTITFRRIALSDWGRSGEAVVAVPPTVPAETR